MTSVVFVHGTGGRQQAYAETLQQMEKALHERNLNAQLVPCLWGDLLGAKLNADGASIPSYREAKGGIQLSPEEENIRLWAALYEDPLYEMRLLSLRPLQDYDLVPGRLTPDQVLQQRVDELCASEELKAKLEQLGIGEVFDQACDRVAGPDSKPFGRLLETASSNLAEDFEVIARAIVAASIELCERQGIACLLSNSADLRDEAVIAIQQQLSKGQAPMGIGQWVKDLLVDVGLNLATYPIRRRRGAIMDGAYPAAGDILIYQSKGQEIREFIRSQILSPKVPSPVVLLAHSLGGIACVDLLIKEDLRDKVTGLITVGSQAPFFYEIGALQTLPYGKPLPDHFPSRWLNIYDLRDFLSYVSRFAHFHRGV
jgi:hypothetical protein